jgi:hypothetical protein
MFEGIVFDADGVVHLKFISQGQTMNQHLCTDVLQHLQGDV